MRGPHVALGHVSTCLQFHHAGTFHHCRLQSACWWTKPTDIESLYESFIKVVGGFISPSRGENEKYLLFETTT